MRIFQIMEPAFFAPRDIVISLGKNLAQKMLYKSYIETVAKIFVKDKGAYVPDTVIAQDALDVVDFEIELAKVAIEQLFFNILFNR